MTDESRYVAFLRGVMPTNCTMPQLRESFAAAGFGDVRTLLSSGNVVFVARDAPWPELERRAEEAMAATMGRSFPTIVRSADHVRALVASDPFAEFGLPATAKRIVTFLHRPPDRAVALPVERDGARILKLVGAEAFSAYEPTPKGPVFMTLLERTFGKEITTRTLATVERCARA